MKPTLRKLSTSDSNAIPVRGLRFSPGFALIVTLSLMILLTVVAVGLLTLSSVALRTASQSELSSRARANARLALMLAIGDLQKEAGPDQRVTARADVLDGDSNGDAQKKIANPQLTGLWKSWEVPLGALPQASDYDTAVREKRFLGWLVSCPVPSDAKKIDYVAGPPTTPVALWDKGTLGKDAPATSIVTAAKVPVAASGSTTRGGLAWAILDEGVKARINTTFRDDATSSGQKAAQLSTGERPGVEFIPGLGGLKRSFYKKDTENHESNEVLTLSKGISRLNFSLAAENLAPGVASALKPLFHDVTTHSVGLFTDTARGGLKQDFQLLTKAGVLPAKYKNQGIYQSLLGMDSAAAPSDPSWNAFGNLAVLYRDKMIAAGGMPLLRTQVPPGWQAATQSDTSPPVITVNKAPPPGLVLMPTIAKVQILFSLVGRDIYGYPGPAGNVIPPDAPQIHSPQGEYFRDTKYEYDLHLLYTPIVSLHNPYNVAIEFSSMRVEFVHVPFAMQIFRNGAPQSKGLVPLETMYGDNRDGKTGKIFGMNLMAKNASGGPGSATVRLLPGEVKMFSPYIDPKRTYAEDLRNRTFWDIYVSTGLTTNITAIPGWPGDGIGFDADNIRGSLWDAPADKNLGHWEAGLGLARDDEIHVEFAPLSIPLSRNKFIIRTSIPGGGAVVNSIEMDYESPTGLQDLILGKGSTLRYPKATAVPNTIRGIDLVDHSTTPIGSLSHVRPFALLSAQAKSTSGGRDVSNKDGRNATKPWCFAHANIASSSQKVVSEHPANHSHEIDLQVLENGTSNLLPIDAQDRTVFISGHTRENGTKFGAQYEIPLSPIRTLAGLNAANPGGSSGYLPRFAQPIGNSWAHPLISPDQVVEAGTGGSYLDHSYLLNLSLYDTFYFSGLGDQTGKFGSAARTTEAFANGFAGMDGLPLDDPRLKLNVPDGKASSDFPNEVASSSGYATVAAWQTMEGAFNVNSTSVAAWKAMLASVHGSQSVLNKLDKTKNTSTFAALPPVGSDECRISRFSLPASNSFEGGGEAKDSYWLGPREYSDGELQRLAESIVRQVRVRGPFLSMADFVNRQLAPGKSSMRGALQQAIDDSNLNEGIAVSANAGFEIPGDKVAGYKYANPAAGAGSSFQGAPGYLSQADLLNVLGNAATPRSDTFTIRGYGEARDAAGKVVLARAVCEAVVQRVPNWVDPSDKVEVPQSQLISVANRTFGRRFHILSFRWLDASEV